MQSDSKDDRPRILATHSLAMTHGQFGIIEAAVSILRQANDVTFVPSTVAYDNLFSGARKGSPFDLLVVFNVHSPAAGAGHRAVLLSTPMGARLTLGLNSVIFTVPGEWTNGQIAEMRNYARTIPLVSLQRRPSYVESKITGIVRESRAATRLAARAFSETGTLSKTDILLRAQRAAMPSKGVPRNKETGGPQKTKG